MLNTKCHKEVKLWQQEQQQEALQVDQNLQLSEDHLQLADRHPQDQQQQEQQHQDQQLLVRRLQVVVAEEVEVLLVAEAQPE